MTDTPPPFPDSHSPPPIPAEWESEGTSRAVDSEKSQAAGRIFPCPQCGADVVFHIGTQQLKCPYCGYQQQLSIAEDAVLVERDYHQELERLREFHEQEAAAVSGLKEVQCDACNGHVVFEGTLTSTHCPYCASPIQLADIHELEVRITPDGVLPFQVSEVQARRAIQKWVETRWFAPNEFKKQGAQGELNGVYFPYWTFDSMTSNQYRGQRGETYTVTVGSGKNQRRVTRVRWYPASGSFQRFFDDVLVLGSQNMSPQLILGLEPWPLQKTLPFTREALAGYLARTYDVGLDQGFEKAQIRMKEAIHQEVLRRIGGDRQRVDQIKTLHAAITFKLIILPIWLLSYRYQNRVYQVMINAATGQVSGERPWSAWKIAFAILLGTLGVGGTWLFLRVITG